MTTNPSPSQLEYLLQPKAKELLGLFSSIFRIRTTFFSLDGEEVCAGLNLPCCDYCRQLWTVLDGDCNTLNHKMCKQAIQQNKAVCYTCHGQMTEAVLPITLAGRSIGFIMVGQFRTLGKNTFKISKDWKSPSPNFAEKLKKYYDRTPLFSEQQVRDMLQMLNLIVDYITSHHLVTMKDFDLIQPLMNRIQNNPAETLTINEAASFIGRSPSSLFQLFKNFTGQGFNRFQTECKLNEADRLLKTFPQMPVKEIAEQIGFSDPLYFSRLYRKYRGAPPSAKKSTGLKS